MSSRSEKDRRTVIERKSPLAGHSLNQRNMRDHRAGLVRVFGKEVNKAEGVERRDQARTERKQALYDGIVNIFNGQPTEEDILSVMLLAEEFEQGDCETPQVTIIDFTDLKPTDARFGEPGLFRRKE
jgi:hypothetical protein